MVEEIICLQCGDRGFENAFVFCIRCLNFAVHRYCLDVIPDTFDEVVRWLCDDCKVKARCVPSPARRDEALKHINGFPAKGTKKNGALVVEADNRVCSDGPEQAYDAHTISALVEYVESTPLLLDGKNDEYGIISPQLEEENVDGNLMEPIIESSTEEDKHNVAMASYNERVKVDINECTRSKTVELSAGCVEQKKEIENNGKRKRNMVKSPMKKDQPLATTPDSEHVEVDISECLRLASDPIKLPAGCVEQNKMEINKKRRKKKKKRKRNHVEPTTEKDQQRIATTSYNESLKVDINHCTRSGSDPTELPAGCLEQKEKEIKNERKRNIMESTLEKDQHRLATTSDNGRVEVDIDECPRLTSDPIELPAGCPEKTNTGIKKKRKKKKNRKRNIVESTTAKDQQRNSTALPSEVRDDECQYTQDLSSTVSQPVAVPIWRGSFYIRREEYDKIDELIAHISNKACHKVYETASAFQSALHLERFPKSDIWPKSFMTAAPDGDSIALYFFPSKMSEQVFDQLVEEMIHEELAFKARMHNIELLIFASTELPLRYWRFNRKYYLWGVFRQNRASNSLSSIAETPSMRKRYDGRSPISPLSNSGTSGSGSLGQ